MASKLYVVNKSKTVYELYESVSQCSRIEIILFVGRNEKHTIIC